MAKNPRWRCSSVLVVGALMMALAGDNTAQEKKPYEKHDASALYGSLRDVINNGAKIFNETGDHVGCYRMYQGALLSVKPFLSPGLQKKIDEGLTKAEGLPSFADRAFKLRDVLDEVRAQVKPGGALETPKMPKKAPEDKKDVDDKKPGPKGPEKKADDKKTAASPSNMGHITGKIALNGKALASGYFVTLVAGDQKRFSIPVSKDGSFQFQSAIPTGDYRIIVEPIAGEKSAGTNVPARYGDEKKSGLSIRIEPGDQKVELNLVN